MTHDELLLRTRIRVHTRPTERGPDKAVMGYAALHVYICQYTYEIPFSRTCGAKRTSFPNGDLSRGLNLVLNSIVKSSLDQR